MRLMVTGHRDIYVERVQPSLADLVARANESLAGTDETFTGIVGGAKGADLTLADVCLDQHLDYEMYIPHPDFFDRYQPCSEEAWGGYLAQAKVRHYSRQEGSFDWRYNFIRNGDMINTATHRVIISRLAPHLLRQQNRGGTAHCVRTLYLAGIRHAHWIHADTGEIKWANLEGGD